MPKWLIALALLTLPVSTQAHDLFTAYVQHRITVTAGQKHIDVTVDLTFFEEWSERERAQMDADGDKRISRDEREAYLKRLAPELAKQMRLRVAGRELELIPLYDPELNLLNSDSVRPDHHRLRLCFFAVTPATLRGGAEIAVEDSLWPEAKALCAIEAEGREGYVLEARKPRDPALPPIRPRETRTFKVTCLQAPPEKPKP